MKRPPYAQDTLLHGNDERGIDVSIASRFPIARIVTHAFDHSNAAPRSAAIDPDTGSLDELLTQPELTDAMKLPVYAGLPGTYQHATAKEKLDYLLLSPALRERVRAVDVCRKGYYAPKKWESFDSLNAEAKDRFQASDHHCLWAEVEL